MISFTVDRRQGLNKGIKFTLVHSGNVDFFGISCLTIYILTYFYQPDKDPCIETCYPCT